ncbi:hypothetical protein BJL90_17025 [Clostridium formicaceticum]|uniref:Transposase IS200-like domain-containing protein n=1 Tax=Clostridium formicaceticum TaxID=1497 RepID=A0ABN4T9W6_9CLOT|nr:hypothetical protein BJL90_17025 [Clostridium formicaceticum]
MFTHFKASLTQKCNTQVGAAFFKYYSRFRYKKANLHWFITNKNVAYNLVWLTGLEPATSRPLVQQYVSNK